MRLLYNIQRLFLLIASQRRSGPNGEVGNGEMGRHVIGLLTKLLPPVSNS